MNAVDRPCVVLRHPGGTFEAGIRPATEQPSGFEIGSLLANTGLMTYDPGFRQHGRRPFGHHLEGGRRSDHSDRTGGQT
jgi:hypothetical protein